MAKTIIKSKKSKSMTKSKIKCVKNDTKSSMASKKAVLLDKLFKKVSKTKVTRINYSHEDLANALKAINKGISLRKAATAYGVPIATLSRKKRNPETSKQKPGPATVFSDTEEQKIVDWIFFRAQHGLPVTKTELLDSVQQYVKLSKKETPFINSRPSRHWYEGFRKRHPQMLIRKSQNLAHRRAIFSKKKIPDELTEDRQTHLLTFENNLSKNVLKEFKRAWLNRTWPRDLQVRGLFKYWLAISKKCFHEEEFTYEGVLLESLNLRQEQTVNNLIYDQTFTVNGNNNDNMINDHSYYSNQEFSPLINYPEQNKAVPPEALYIIIVKNDPHGVVPQTQSDTHGTSASTAASDTSPIVNNSEVQRCPTFTQWMKYGMNKENGILKKERLQQQNYKRRSMC
ncbi:uncharacterized protein [Battus philenor]|uniref:uncharacterized protein isoform X2 n=1 Tax=Battus philenor TaxID=42288 RepID=UPI0035D0DCB1